jgi:hypothetical protein
MLFCNELRFAIIQNLEEDFQSLTEKLGILGRQHHTLKE